MKLKQIKNLIHFEMEKSKKYIETKLVSKNEFINKTISYVIKNEGKKIRTTVLILMSKILKYSGEQNFKAAGIIECIHTATLIHDDIIDQPELRRGKKTTNNLWGNSYAVLIGDFLYSRAFEMMVELDSMEIMKILSSTTNQIAEGEIKQLIHCKNLKTTKEIYMKIIYDKTSRLFESTCEIAGVLADVDDVIKNCLKKCGLHFGNVFQIADDINDYVGNPDYLGKPTGNDLNEGKMTLPIIYALKNLIGNNKNKLEAIIKTSDKLKNIKEVKNAIESCGAIELCKKTLSREFLSAEYYINKLPSSTYREALLSILEEIGGKYKI